MFPGLPLSLPTLPCLVRLPIPGDSEAEVLPKTKTDSVDE